MSGAIVASLGLLKFLVLLMISFLLRGGTGSCSARNVAA